LVKSLSKQHLIKRQDAAIINLVTDPKEREPYNPVYLHSWTMAHFGRLLKEFQESVKRESLIPAGAPLDHVPKRTQRSN